MIPGFCFHRTGARQIRRGLLSALLVAGSALAARAQERLTLQQAIDRALIRAYDVQIARNAADQAAKNNTWGAAGLLPTVGVTGTATTNTVNTLQRFSDGRTQERAGARSTQYGAVAGVDYTLYNGGRAFLSKKQLDVLESLEAVRLRERMNATVASVVQSYAAAVFQQQQGVAIDTGLVLARVRMDLSEVKFELGSAPKTDYLQARVDYNARQSDSVAQEAALTRAYADLAYLLVDPLETRYAVDDSLTLNQTLQPSTPELLKASPLVDIAAKTAEVSRLNYRIIRTARLPLLTVNAGYSYNRQSSAAGLLLFNRSFGPTAGAGINIPLYQGGAIRRNIAIAGLEAARTELLAGQQATATARQYRQAWADYTAAVASYDLERQNIGYAKENLDIQRARFRLGVATTLESRQAESDYVAALVRLYQAGYNVKAAEVRVLEAEGSLVR